MESRSVVPVEGQVLINDKPQPGVHVSFFPTDPAQQGKPHGVTDAEGKFRLETYRQDGAPPGEYEVAVFWPLPNPKDEDDGQALPDRLGRRYADPKTSGLRATVTSKAATLSPFHLK
jgi:hypothetical protein